MPVVGSVAEPRKIGSPRPRRGAPGAVNGSNSSPGAPVAAAVAASSDAVAGGTMPPKLTGPLTAAPTRIKIPDNQLPAETACGTHGDIYLIVSRLYVQ